MPLARCLGWQVAAGRSQLGKTSEKNATGSRLARPAAVTALLKGNTAVSASPSALKAAVPRMSSPAPRRLPGLRVLQVQLGLRTGKPQLRLRGCYLPLPRIAAPPTFFALLGSTGGFGVLPLVSPLVLARVFSGLYAMSSPSEHSLPGQAEVPSPGHRACCIAQLCS